MPVLSKNPLQFRWDNARRQVISPLARCVVSRSNGHRLFQSLCSAAGQLATYLPLDMFVGRIHSARFLQGTSYTSKDPRLLAGTTWGYLWLISQARTSEEFGRTRKAKLKNSSSIAQEACRNGEGQALAYALKYTENSSAAGTMILYQY